LKDRLCIDPGGTDSIDALESALAQVRDERDALGTELAQQQQCLLARQQDYQTLQDERNALADTVAGLRQEIDGHLDYKLKLSNELHQAKAQVNQRQQLLTEAEIAIIDLRKELDSIKAQLSICGKPSPPHAPGLEGNEMKKWLKRVYCWLTHQWWGSWHYWGKGYVGYHHFRCDRCKEHWVIYHGN
jgi:seryl-tRNA synthetase